MFKIDKTDNGVTFRVRVQPGAAKNKIVGVQRDALRVRINAPPAKGKSKRRTIRKTKKLGHRSPAQKEMWLLRLSICEPILSIG